MAIVKRGSVKHLTLPLLAEEILHESLALLFEYSCLEFCLGVQSVGCIDVETAFVVGCTIHHAAYLRPSQCACTHRTGFHSDIQCAVCQILSPQILGCCGDGLHLGMGCYIVKPLGEVVCAGYDTSLADNYGTDGNLTLIFCFARLGKCLTHIHLVVLHLFSCCVG